MVTKTLIRIMKVRVEDEAGCRVVGEDNGICQYGTWKTVLLSSRLLRYWLMLGAAVRAAGPTSNICSCVLSESRHGRRDETFRRWGLGLPGNKRGSLLFLDGPVAARVHGQAGGWLLIHLVGCIMLIISSLYLVTGAYIKSGVGVAIWVLWFAFNLVFTSLHSALFRGGRRHVPRQDEALRGWSQGGSW